MEPVTNVPAATEDGGTSAYVGLYAWSVANGDSLGSLGVTSDLWRADAHLASALERMPGDQVTGVIQQAWLDNSAKAPRYRYGDVMLRARREGEPGGAINWGIVHD
ncbi:hypothetical protein ACIBG7_12395 [Nonomuraea sp. NPDC050328]|uniref:hypothetical protein n=1 Tax=Nonomuraea sp. NPDC050328 TaxID=3364361 RepID=UPI0037BAE913